MPGRHGSDGHGGGIGWNPTGVSCDRCGEARWIGRWGVADEAALAEVCRREYPRLVGLIALKVGDRHVAEELAQDTLAQLCRRWAKIDRPEAWLTRVALNTANSWWRRRVAERKAYRRHGTAPDELRPPDPADAVAVRRAVSSLPRRQQTALILRFYEDLSVAQTAAVMGCAEGTVKSLTHRALNALESTGDLTGEEAIDHA